MAITVDTTGFERSHEKLLAGLNDLRALAGQLPALPLPEREQARERLLWYLHDEVEPHTKLDEQLLYPAVAERLGDALIAVSMRYDHLAIRHWISKVAEADMSDTDRLQRLLYGLDALIRVHVWKENELFLASLESGSWPHSGC